MRVYLVCRAQNVQISDSLCPTKCYYTYTIIRDTSRVLRALLLLLLLLRALRATRYTVIDIVIVIMLLGKLIPVW